MRCRSDWTILQREPNGRMSGISGQVLRHDIPEKGFVKPAQGGFLPATASKSDLV